MYLPNEFILPMVLHLKLYAPLFIEFELLKEKCTQVGFYDFFLNCNNRNCYYLYETAKIAFFLYVLLLWNNFMLKFLHF